MLRHRQNLDIPEEKIDEKESLVSKHETKNVIKTTKSSPISVENIAWVLCAIGTCYFTDIISALMYDNNIDRSWLQASILFGVVLLSIASFLIVYLYLIRNVDPDNWDVMYPSAIPCATASGLLCGICLTIAIWPVYGLLSLPILFILFMGGICVICMLDVFTVLCKKNTP